MNNLNFDISDIGMKSSQLLALREEYRLNVFGKCHERHK
jgi:hypothetical protein